MGTLNMIDYPDGTLADVPLWSGRVSWTHDEDAMKSIDVPALAIEEDKTVLMLFRNSSPTVDLTAFVGGLIKPVFTEDISSKVWTAGGVVATDVVTTVDPADGTTPVAHGLNAGDAIEIVTSAGGVGAAGTIYYLVGPSNSAAHSTTIGANTFCLAAARGSDTVVNITATDVFTFKLASEFYKLTTVSVPKFAAGTTLLPVAGMVQAVVTGWGRYGGQLRFAKSAATSAIMDCYIEIRRAELEG